MKLTAVSAIMPVMCALLALPSMTDGAKKTIQVSDGDVMFTIDRYDDSRSLPYVVSFTDFGFKSIYKFNDHGQVLKIRADGDDYTVKYRNNGRVRRVTRVGARRDLAEDVENGVDAMVEEGSLESRRRLHPCHDCHDAWNEICSTGVGIVCDLVSYGNPFLAPAETSMGVLCSSLGALCEDLSPEEACTEECESCLPPLTITLEWSTYSDEDPAYIDLHVIEPNHNIVYYLSPVGEAGFIHEYLNKQVYIVQPELSSDSYSDFALGDYLVFGEWYAGGYPVYWTINAVTGSGEVVLSGQGEFTGECDSASSDSQSSSTYTKDMTGMFNAALNEYVDNDCGITYYDTAATTAAKSARPGRG